MKKRLYSVVGPWWKIHSNRKYQELLHRLIDCESRHTTRPIDWSLILAVQISYSNQKGSTLNLTQSSHIRAQRKKGHFTKLNPSVTKVGELVQHVSQIKFSLTSNSENSPSFRHL